MFRNTTGIILSGGTSSRMGENKALLPLGNKRVIEHITELMQSIFSKVILITNTTAEYTFLGLPMFSDIYRVGGPLAGIHSGLENSKTADNFILSCDMPLMESGVIKSIVEFKTDKPITVCRSEGHIQHLAGRYSKSILDNTVKLLQVAELSLHGKGKHNANVHSLLHEVGFEIIAAESISGYHPEFFFNMNNKEDYKKMLSLF